MSLPVEMSVASGLNALAHCVDSMWAPNADPINAAFAAEGIRSLAAGLPKVVADPMDLDGREHALYAAYLSATAFASAGSGLHHKICHVLGGKYNLPHAQTHATVLPYVLAFNGPGGARRRAADRRGIRRGRRARRPGRAEAGAERAARPGGLRLRPRNRSPRPPRRSCPRSPRPTRARSPRRTCARCSAPPGRAPTRGPSAESARGRARETPTKSVIPNEFRFHVYPPTESHGVATGVSRIRSGYSTLIFLRRTSSGVESPCASGTSHLAAR